MKYMTLLLFFPLTAFFLNDGDARIKKQTINDLSWLSGKWIGKEWNGDIEEYWSGPLGKTMVGVFRFVRNDTTKVLELLTIEETSGEFVLRFKHFDTALKAWEDNALIFNLKKMEERKLIFESSTQSRPKRMIYHEVAADSLVVTVESEIEGKISSFQVHKKKVRL